MENKLIVNFLETRKREQNVWSFNLKSALRKVDRATVTVPPEKILLNDGLNILMYVIDRKREGSGFQGTIRLL